MSVWMSARGKFAVNGCQSVVSTFEGATVLHDLLVLVDDAVAVP